VKYLKQQAKDIVERSLGYQVEELPEDEVNLALYLIYLRGNSMFEWMKNDQYNQEAKLYELMGEEIMDTHVKEMLDKILNEYDDVVFKEFHDIRNCKLVKHDIRLNNERPIKCKQSPRLAKENEQIKGQIDEMLKNGVIKPLISPYVFNIIIVEKKDKVEEKMNKLCINYRSLNKIIILDRYLLSNINEIYNRF